jgi:hypothetical protein
MASAFASRAPVVLFFLAGMVPTDDERDEAAKYGPGVKFRNSLMVNNDTSTSAVEECDFVAGKVPERYAAVYRNVSEFSSDYENRSSDYDLPHSRNARDPLNERSRGARPPAINELPASGVPAIGLPARAGQGWENNGGGLVGGTEGRQESPVNSPGGYGERVGLAPNDPGAAFPGSPGWPHGGDPRDKDTVGDGKAMTGTPTGRTDVPNEGEAALFKVPAGFSSAAGASTPTSPASPAAPENGSGDGTGDGSQRTTYDESMSRAELDEAAKARGLNPDDYSNKSLIVAALNAA